MNPRAAIITILMLGLGLAVPLRAEVRVWELPEGKTAPEDRTGWKPGNAASQFANGAALENEWLIVLIGANTPGPVVRTKSGNVRADVALVAPDGSTGAIKDVRLREADMMEAVIGFAAGSSEANLILSGGKPCVGFAPVKNAARLEVKAPARYAVAPGFHADDRLYDAASRKSDLVPIAARPALIQLLDGRGGVLALLWDGSAKDEDGKTNPAKGWEPRQVELRLAGDGAARCFAAARIEFRDKPLHIGLLQGANIWQDIDVRELPGAKTVRVGWKRPFDAVWRANLVSGDFDRDNAAAFLKQADELGLSHGHEAEWQAAYPTSAKAPADTEPRRAKSFSFQLVNKDGELPLDKPAEGGESRVWPCVFRGEETLVTVPAAWPCYPNPTHDRLRMANERRANQGREPLSPIHAWDKLVIYPFDRTARTPILQFAFEDLMRQALGTGPCDLDWWRDILR